MLGQLPLGEIEIASGFSEGAVAAVVNDMLGDQDPVGGKPYVVDVSTGEKLELRRERSDEWVTIQHRQPGKPQESYLFQKVDDAWVYAKPEDEPPTLPRLRGVFDLLIKS